MIMNILKGACERFLTSILVVLFLLGISAIFSSNIALAATVRVQEPCTTDTDQPISNLATCTIYFRSPGTETNVHELVITVTPTGCGVVEVDTKSFDDKIVGARDLVSFCTTSTGKVSALSNVVTHTFLGRPSRAPEITVQD